MNGKMAKNDGGECVPIAIVGINTDEIFVEESLTQDEDDDCNTNCKNNDEEEKKIDGDTNHTNNSTVSNQGTGNDDGPNSVQESPSISDSQSRQSIANDEFRKQQQQKETKELWALLNYSKVRLATGSTPTPSEAKTLGIPVDHELTPNPTQEEDEQTEKDIKIKAQQGSKEYDSAKTDHRDDDNLGHDDDEYDNYDNEDDDSIFSNDSSIDGFNKSRRSESNLANNSDQLSYDDSYRQDSISNRNNSDISNEDARARALAALAMASSRELKGDDQSENKQMLLSEKQLLQSMLLAEEASLSGEAQFATKDKLRFLDSIQLSSKAAVDNNQNGRSNWNIMKVNRNVSRNGRAIGHSNNNRNIKSTTNVNRNATPGFWGGIMNMKKKKTLSPTKKDEPKDFSQRTKKFFAFTKFKAERAMEDIKGNIAKAEDRQELATSPISPVIAPFKDLKDRIAQVDRMYATKYQDQDPAHGPFDC